MMQPIDTIRAERILRNRNIEISCTACSQLNDAVILGFDLLKVLKREK
jgi:hypothetical protein